MSDRLREAVENLLARPTFIGDEGFEPTLTAVSAGHLGALRAALAATEAPSDIDRRDAYWRSVLRGLGARPVTCATCSGSGTVNSADTEPCVVCDGSGTAWVK